MVTMASYINSKKICAAVNSAQVQYLRRKASLLNLLPHFTGMPYYFLKQDQQPMHFPKIAIGFGLCNPVASGCITYAMAALLLGLPFSARAAQPAAPLVAAGDSGTVSSSQDTRRVTDWIVASSNHKGQAFAIIDKRAAMLHVFDKEGTRRASSPVLLGLAVGDASVPGIGERKLSQIRPDERTTPAGRFVSEPGVNLQGEDIVWIDYDAAVSMHRVRTGNKADRRLERLATPGASDNRSSYGCVNVPAAFYDSFVKPVFGSQPAVVYVLPETTSVSAFFNMPGAAPAVLADGK